MAPWLDWVKSQIVPGGRRAARVAGRVGDGLGMDTRRGECGERERPFWAHIHPSLFPPSVRPSGDSPSPSRRSWKSEPRSGGRRACARRRNEKMSRAKRRRRKGGRKEGRNGKHSGQQEEEEEEEEEEQNRSFNPLARWVDLGRARAAEGEGGAARRQLTPGRIANQKLTLGRRSRCRSSHCRARTKEGYATHELPAGSNSATPSLPPSFLCSPESNKTPIGFTRHKWHSGGVINGMNSVSGCDRKDCLSRSAERSPFFSRLVECAPQASPARAWRELRISQDQ